MNLHTIGAHTSFVPTQSIVECMIDLGFWYVIYTLIVLLKNTNTKQVMKSLAL
jgi:hypothetical protein